jgi:hypothetical protein
LKVGVIRVTRAKGLQNIAVVFAALVGVLDQQANRCARGLALENARQDLHLVGFIALRHVPAGTGATAVKFDLNISLAQQHARRAAVNHAANGWAVGFTKVGDGEKGSKGIAAHRKGLSQTSASPPHHANTIG